MRCWLVPFLLLVFAGLACTLNSQSLAEAEPTQSSTPVLVPATETSIPENVQDLDGPEINYNGIRFTLDPLLGSHLYAFKDEDYPGTQIYNTRLTPTSEEYCRTWCLIVYHVADHVQKFGQFAFLPHRSAVTFKAQEKTLSLQNSSGERSLETFGQMYYGVSNESLKYIFRGYTTDKQYAVYVQTPIRTASLPDVEPTSVPGHDPVQDILQYNRQATQTLNALTSADFTPSLDVLDGLVASIQVGTP